MRERELTDEERKKVTEAIKKMEEEASANIKHPWEGGLWQTSPKVRSKTERPR